jgi:hypothetical protein
LILYGKVNAKLKKDVLIKNKKDRGLDMIDLNDAFISALKTTWIRRIITSN